jgi:ribosomal protein S27AE
MMTYAETIDLREKLEKDEISLDKAKEMCIADVEENKRSWHTKDWKERRKQVIKDKCEQCGSTVNLTLQHQSHPDKYSKYYLDAYIHFHDIFINENSNNFNNLVTKEDILYYIDNTPREEYSMCPKCGGGYYTRRKEPRLVCNRCKYEFDKPTIKLLPEYIDNLYSDFDIASIDKPANAPGDRKVKHFLLYSEIQDKIAKEKIKHMVKDKYQSAIDKKAMIDYLDATIQYLSFEDTITLCRKCAFNQDKTGRDLCPVCKIRYKPIQYETCVDCLPDGERKNQIKEYYEFVKEMNEMHKYLEND